MDWLIDRGFQFGMIKKMPVPCYLMLGSRGATLGEHRFSDFSFRGFRL